MNTKEVIEKLPWLMNGTLDPSEAEEVRRTLRESEECRIELKELAEAGVLFGGRIPRDVLLSYISGEEIAPYDREAIERLLDASPAGAEEWQMASESWNATRQAESSETTESKRETEVATPASAPSSVPTERPEATVIPFRKPEGGPTQVPSAWRNAAIAASIVAAVGLGGWLNALQKPSLGGFNPTVVEVGALESDIVLRNNGTVSVVERATPDGVQLISLDGDGGVRTLELLDASGELAWAPQQEFRGDEYGDFIVALPGNLAAGKYTVQLYDGPVGDREPAERYAIELR